MLIKTKYIIIGFLFCFVSQTITGASIFQLKKNQPDSCYADFKSLQKAIDKINENHTDNYLNILLLYNYNFDSAKYAKQWNYPNFQNSMETLLWQAYMAICTDAFDTADSILQTIAAELDTTNTEFNKHYEIVAADFSIKTYDYEKALTHLLKIEQLPLTRKLQMRTKFIIAQIYNQLGYYKEAIPYYDKALKQPFGVEKLMKSYSIVYKHFCEKLLEEEEQQRLLALNAKKTEIIPEEFEPTVVESTHDSSFINMDYPYYFNDEAAMFFLDETMMEDDDVMEDFDDNMDTDDDELTDEMLENIFENWESIAIHIPKTDFSAMTDTIYLPLIKPDADYSLPHFNSIVSRFGWRRYRYHYGVDTKNSLGDSILCVFDGVVRIAKRNKTYGNVIIVRHYNGLETFYAHCSKLLVEHNQEVKAGELIALVGNTGRSRGPHLHFETRYKGAAFNPEYMIDFEKNKLISDTLAITRETFNYSRSGSSSSTIPSPSGAVYYKIRSGDTLSGIAKKYRTSVTNIKRLNGLKSDFIREGQRIRVL